MELIIKGGAGTITISKMQTTQVVPFREKDSVIITIDLYGMTKRAFLKMITPRRRK